MVTLVGLSYTFDSDVKPSFYGEASTALTSMCLVLRLKGFDQMELNLVNGFGTG